MIKYPRTHYENFVKMLGKQDFDEDAYRLFLLGATKAKPDQYNIQSYTNYVKNTASMIHEFYKSGKKVFRYSEDLCLLLYHTEFKQVEAKYIKAPFNIFYVTGFGSLGLTTPDGLPTDGCYISFLEPTFEQKDYIIKKYKRDFNIEYKKDEILSYISFYFVCEDIELSSKYIDKMNEFLIPFVLTEGDIFKQFEVFLKNYTSKEFSPEIQDMLIEYIKLMINFILYLNSDELIIEKIKPINPAERKKNPAKKKKALKHAGSLIPYNYVGGNIVINNKDKEIFLNCLHEHKNKKWTDSWLVRGHWHGYWVNEVNDNDKVKFFSEGKRKYFIKKYIKPYIKGEGEIKNKEYKVI